MAPKLQIYTIGESRGMIFGFNTDGVGFMCIETNARGEVPKLLPRPSLNLPVPVADVARIQFHEGGVFIGTLYTHSGHLYRCSLNAVEDVMDPASSWGKVNRFDGSMIIDPKATKLHLEARIASRVELAGKAERDARARAEANRKERERLADAQKQEDEKAVRLASEQAKQKVSAIDRMRDMIFGAG